MTLGKLWVIAYRDLGRNRRRSTLTLLAVALGLALLIMMNGLIAGVLEDSLQNAIRLRTGHVQLRAESYEEERHSLASADLLGRLDELMARVNAVPGVRAVTPELWAGAALSTADESVNLLLVGIDPTSAVHDPIREGVVAGEFLAPDDRDGVLLGKQLADSLGVGVGQKVSLTVVDADGKAAEGPFEVRGLFATGVPSFDESAVMMPLAKAQAFTGARGRASALIILADDQDAAPRIAETLRGPGLHVVDYRDMNSVLLQAVQTGMSFYVLLDVIVMLVVAVVIANTLLMSVFERIREIGILSALGMRRRQVLSMFVLEAAILGLAGIAVGLLIGLASVAYLAKVGIPIGGTANLGGSITLSTSMYARFVPVTFAWLSVGMLAILLLGSLYPAWFAARLEPADALHRS